MPSVIFLGAGASKPFEIPTMQEMVTRFEEKLDKENPELHQYYTDVKNSLVSEYGETQVDIESMFSVIQGIANKTEPKDLGHFAYYYMTKIIRPYEIDSTEIELAKKLQIELEKYIKKTCGLKLSSSQSTEIYKKSYVPLFSYIVGEKKGYQNGFELATDWKAFTTNYDLIFEGFWHSFEKPIDHFDIIGSSNMFKFSRKNLSPHSLSKLHGSLDWTKDVENGDIIRRKESSFDTVKTEGNVMLFPIQQKDMYLHPWFTLFQDLKNGLLQNEIWYVIGYAFNDPFIFNVFEEALSYGNSKLVIINPEASEIRNKFSEKNLKFIIPLQIKFGDEFFERDFVDFTSDKRRLELKISGQMDYFAIKIKDGFTDLSLIENKGFLENVTLEKNNNEYHKAEFHARDKENKNISFEMDTIYNYLPESKIEIEFITNFKDTLTCDISNQGRFIDTFTINDWESSEDMNYFTSKIILDYETLFRN